MSEYENLDQSEVFHNPEDDQSPSYKQRNTPIRGIRIVKPEAIFGPIKEDYSDDENLDTIKGLIEWDLSNIVGVETLKDWKKWDFDFSQMVLETPDIALEYIGWVSDKTVKTCGEPYVDSLRRLNTDQLERLIDMVNKYLTVVGSTTKYQ